MIGLVRIVDVYGPSLRIRVLVDVKKRLRKLISIVVKGNIRSFFLQFERLTDFCNRCGHCTHIKNESLAPANSIAAGNQFGGWLRHPASPCKEIRVPVLGEQVMEEVAALVVQVVAAPLPPRMEPAVVAAIGALTVVPPEPYASPKVVNNELPLVEVNVGQSLTSNARFQDGKKRVERRRDTNFGVGQPLKKPCILEVVLQSITCSLVG